MALSVDVRMIEVTSRIAAQPAVSRASRRGRPGRPAGRLDQLDQHAVAAARVDEGDRHPRRPAARRRVDQLDAPRLKATGPSAPRRGGGGPSSAARSAPRRQTWWKPSPDLLRGSGPRRSSDRSAGPARPSTRRPRKAMRHAVRLDGQHQLERQSEHGPGRSPRLFEVAHDDATWWTRPTAPSGGGPNGRHLFPRSSPSPPRR
jgi:hypothetical protein